jgi:hypothetical protein
MPHFFTAARMPANAARSTLDRQALIPVVR